MPLGEEDIEKLFAQREEIDRALLERHTREMAVLFTDIVGSTQYFEQKGDIEGMRLIQRHNKLLFPVVESHRGRVVKTIGDAIMAVFDSAEDSVRCALEMHRALDADKTDPRIHIRAGAHFGRAFAKGTDVFGDTVNTAARVAHEARGDEVLVSQALLDRVAQAPALRPVPRGALTLKGKAAPLPVASVPWSDRVPLPPAVTPMPAFSEPSTQGNEELFVLDLQAGAGSLKVVALDGAADKGTVKAYAEVPVSPAELEDFARRFGTYMHQGGAASYVERVRQEGAGLFAKALSERARKHLLETKCQYLRLQLDDKLVHVPWELLYDGKEFLSLRFASGRFVSARSDTAPSRRLPSESAGGAVVISNASGGLEAADREGEAVAGLLREGFAGGARHVKGPLKRSDFLGALSGCALLHVAGHAEPPGARDSGGFLAQDGRVSPEEVAAAVGAAAPPVVFANSCHASTGRGFTEVARGVSDLASALLLRGTQHYIGPMWEMGDDDALAFALRFYEAALRGAPMGEAARLARQKLLRSGRHPLSFAGYVLYGDPRTVLRGALPKAGLLRSSDPAAVAQVTPDFAPVETERGRPRRTLWPVLLGGGVATVAAAATVLGLTARRPPAPPLPPEPPRAEVKAPPAPVPAPAAPAIPHTGPLRICVFPFKSVGHEGAALGDALQEALYTDLGAIPLVKLIERGQIDLDVHEMDFEMKYADPSTRAALGKLTGAEVALLGGYQRNGKLLRIFGRFIDVESGEVLFTFKLDGPEAKTLDLEEQVVERAKSAIPALQAKLRK